MHRQREREENDNKEEETEEPSPVSGREEEQWVESNHVNEQEETDNCENEADSFENGDNVNDEVGHTFDDVNEKGYEEKGIELSSDVLLASVHKDTTNGCRKEVENTESRESPNDVNKSNDQPLEQNHLQEPKRCV